MIRNQEIKETFIIGPLFSEWMGVSQSLFKCFSIEGKGFI